VRRTTVFPPGDPQTITLTSALPDIITDNLTIDGSNAGVILDGSDVGSIPETVRLDDVSLTLDGGANLIANGGFDAGLGHWRPWDKHPGATRSLNNSDYHSSPNSYEWGVVASARDSSTVYDTTDTSDPVDDPFDAGSTAWISATGGEAVELRFWYKYGNVFANLHALLPDGYENINWWWFYGEDDDWHEAVVTATLLGDATGVALEFGHTHSERWADGLPIESNGNVIRGLQIVNFPGNGIVLHDGAQNNVIGGNSNLGAGPLGRGNLVSSN